jgi:hypothetical protein
VSHLLALVAPSNYLRLLAKDVQEVAMNEATLDEVYPFKAEALHACSFLCNAYLHSVAHTNTDSASSEDPSELSFRRGEVLDILTKSDLWWEARNSQGRKGSQSFVYRSMLPSWRTEPLH